MDDGLLSLILWQRSDHLSWESPPMAGCPSERTKLLPDSSVPHLAAPLVAPISLVFQSEAAQSASRAFPRPVAMPNNEDAGSVVSCWHSAGRFGPRRL